jgi:hypothetical protein
LEGAFSLKKSYFEGRMEGVKITCFHWGSVD